MKPQLWYFLVTGTLSDGLGVLGNFYSYGSHCGEALANTQAVAATLGFINPEPSEACRLDAFEDYQLPENLVRETESVFRSPDTYSYPIADDNQFVAPTGILKSTDEGELEYEVIQPGFTAIKNADSDNYELELVANKQQLIGTFINAINLLPAINSLQIQLQSHWEDSETELWENPGFRTKESVTDFLLENQPSTLDNGFVDCIINLAQPNAKLVLSEYKTIRFSTVDEALFNKFGALVMALGYDQKEELHSLEYGFYHWHYRPHNSLSRTELKKMLTSQGFALRGTVN